MHDFVHLNVGGDWMVLETARASQRTTFRCDAISMLVRAWSKDSRPALAGTLARSPKMLTTEARQSPLSWLYPGHLGNFTEGEFVSNNNFRAGIPDDIGIPQLTKLAVNVLP